MHAANQIDLFLKFQNFRKRPKPSKEYHIPPPRNIEVFMKNVPGLKKNHRIRLALQITLYIASEIDQKVEWVSANQLLSKVINFMYV